MYILDIDDCAGSPCVNGECIDGVNSYECKCNSGYQGRNCENSKKLNQSLFNNDMVMYIKQLYLQLNIVHSDIDDCAGGPCVNGKCIDGVNSYECKCNPGYDGTNCENSKGIYEVLIMTLKKSIEKEYLYKNL